MRFLVDISDDDLRWLDEFSAEQGKSRAALLREAVSAFRAEQSKQGIERYFGLWSAHGSRVDGLDYQRRARGEWGRDWQESGSTEADA